MGRVQTSEVLSMGRRGEMISEIGYQAWQDGG